jgi:hypothetical protein
MRHPPAAAKRRDFSRPADDSASSIDDWSFGLVLPTVLELGHKRLPAPSGTWGRLGCATFSWLSPGNVRSPDAFAKLTAKHYIATMPKGPKGQRRPADVIGNAVHAMRLATGEVSEGASRPEDEGKDPAAVSLGRRGGAARAQKLNKKQRADIAKNAARKRWGAKPT